MAPEYWGQTSLGELLEETEDRAGGATLPVLSVTKARGIMLASERFGKPLHGRDLTRYRVAPRDSLVVDPMLLWDGAVGLQERVDAGLVSPDYRVFRPRPQVDVKFVGYLLKSATMRRHFQSGARGTNVRRNRISRGDFLRIPVRLPPLTEQRKIATILSSVDVAIEKTEAVISQVQVVRRGLLRELLTRGLPGGTPTLEETSLGTLPASWTVRRVGDFSDVAYGLTVNSARRSSEVRAPYLTVANARGDDIDLTELKEIGVLEGDTARYALRIGDVLVIEGNANIDRLGLAYLWRGERDGVLHQNHLIRVRIKDVANILPGWLRLVFNSEASRLQIRDAAKTSSGLHTINSGVVAGLSVPIPPRAEQEAILAASQGIVARLDREQQWLTALRQVKLALLGSLLSGRVRVNVSAQEGA